MEPVPEALHWQLTTLELLLPHLVCHRRGEGQHRVIPRDRSEKAGGTSGQNGA